MASRQFPVAVIGMAVNLPGAKNCEEFWELMENRGDTVSDFPKERSNDIQHVLPIFQGQYADEGNPFFTGSFFKYIDKFDAGLFNINPKEALFIEPEQRMFLEAVWELLEDAGYASKIRDTKTGVYVGHTVNKYKYILTENHPSISHGNHSPFISSRVSYTYNLSGPAMMVATGCSSSLLAVHLACQGLLSGDCDMAIAGGITLDLLPLNLKTDIWNQLGITSAEARCRAFDADAKGISKAEGCGIVLLKPLEQAIQDNDNIYGILEASTANQDGHSQGITAPHPGAQTNMLCQAWTLAGINPQQIGYIEAHGTGTELGDPIEIMGITKAFERLIGSETSKIEKIPIGSVKANIGHLADGAAGVVSLIKVLLCLKMNRIPPSNHFKTPNPHINWDNSPVVVNSELREWKQHDDKRSRYGCVSAFGLLGTNIHIVVKDHSRTLHIQENDITKPQILCLAAKTRNSLLELVANMEEYFTKAQSMNTSQFKNICYTINTGREQKRFKFRVVVAGKCCESIKNELRNAALELKQPKRCLLPLGKDKYSDILDEFQLNSLELFLKGNEIDWIEYYAKYGAAKMTKIGQIPAYPFERVRYWPKFSKPLNREYLQLEHKLFSIEKITQNESNPKIQDISEDENLGKYEIERDLRKCLIEAFNITLGCTYNWEDKGDTDVFSMGVDSLVCTHIAMHLGQVLKPGTGLCFTQSDLHQHPTFNELLQFLNNKLIEKSSNGAKNSDVQSADTDCKSDLEDASGGLSFSQKRLWVIGNMDKTSCAYNATNCLEIVGDLNYDAFKNSVRTVMARHDAFYITVKEVDSVPKLEYNWHTNMEIGEMDMSKFGQEADDLTMKMYEQDYRTGFDTSTGPLARTNIYKVANRKWIFTIVVHHMIFDGWSHFVFLNELWTCYKQFSNGLSVETSLHQPLSSYFGKMEELDSKSNRSKIKEDMEYWLKKLSGPLPLTTYPGDRKRPEVFTYEGNRITRFIDIDKFEKLKSVSNEHTLFHSLLGVVYVSLLYFNPQENDLIVGIPVAGRTSHQMKGVIGCFINTLAIRCYLQETMGFKEILELVSKTCIEAMVHQHAPFDHLVGKLKLSRNTSITPIFSVNVCYHNEEMKSSHIEPPSGLCITRKLVHNATSKWDVQFDFLEESGKMRFTLEYYSGIFSETYALHLADTFEFLMETLSHNIEVPVSKLLQSKTYELAAIIQGPKVELGNKCVGQLLIESFQENSNSKIKVYNGNEYKYEELHQSSMNLVSFFKNKCSLVKGDRVGLLLENSFESISVIAACLISGLVYVPLDVDSPRERLHRIVNDSAISFICFSKKNLAMANHLHWACKGVHSLFCVDEQDDRHLQEENVNPLMDTELWNCVAEEAVTDVEGGGWKNSYTGEYMSDKEMEDFVDNVLCKLEPYIKPDATVLEIGCASGLTTQAICPKVKRYIATDLSENMIKRLQKKQLANVELFCASASDVHQLPIGKKCDIIIINSVVHCFPGHSYLRRVIRKCETLLDDNGILFIGDVMDLNKKDQLLNSLIAFKEANPEHRTKTEWVSELFLPKDFFYCFIEEDLFSTVTCSSKQASIPNELSKFRYDVILAKQGKINNTSSFTKSVKKCYSGKDVVENKDEALQKCILFPDQDDDAYILYTSGTTGIPKGVRISQRALLNYSTWSTKEYSFSKSTCLPLFSPLTFDFTVTSIVPPLLCGSTIEIFKPFQDSYADIAAQTSLNIAKFSPLQLECILSSAKQPLSISKFIVGGEELTYKLLSQLKDNKKMDPFVVWNEYGPTEATVGCVVQIIQSTEIVQYKNNYIPIGLPIYNTTVAVVHDSRPLPRGSKGMLAIGGDCLTSGLVNHSEKHQQFKLACWDSDSKGALMYITSDIVSVATGGNTVMYFGRETTDLTKINGMRVDLLEIQQAIESFYFVQSAAVSTFECDGKTFIGTAIKLQNSNEETVPNTKNTLVQSLSSMLPVHCIPKVMVFVPQLPTTVNGKKDTAILKQLFTDEMAKPLSTQTESFSEKEEEIRQIWRAVLPTHRLPMPNEDFFFDLSGDSLQAIHLVRKLRKANFTVNVNDIFRFPTIRKLSENICKSTSNDQTFAHKQETQFRPTPIVERYIRNKGPSNAYALPGLLRLKNKPKIEHLQQALHSVILKHRSLASKFYINSENTVIQEFCQVKSGTILIRNITVVQRKINLTHEPEFITTCNDLECQLDIQGGTLLNACLFEYIRESDVDYYCLIVIHHIVIDIVSWHQILEDLDSLLRLISVGKTANLSPCLVSMETYCNALWNKGHTCAAREVEFWSNMGQPSEICLINNSPGCSLYASAKWIRVSTDATNLRMISSISGCSDEAILLASLGISLFKISGKQSIHVCLESHGRQLQGIDTTETVGWCTSMFPFEIRIDKFQSLTTNSQNIQKDLRRLPNKGVMFGVLNGLGKIETPLPDIMFVFLGQMGTHGERIGDEAIFQYIPWIEVMTEELDNGRFHRDANDVMDFPLQIICWLYNGRLNVGSLFDRSKVEEAKMSKVMLQMIGSFQKMDENNFDHQSCVSTQTVAEKHSATTQQGMYLTSSTVEKTTVTSFNEFSTDTKVEVLTNISITSKCQDIVKNILDEEQMEEVELIFNDRALFNQKLSQPELLQGELIVIVTRSKTQKALNDLLLLFRACFSKLQNSNKRCIIVSLENIPFSQPFPTDEFPDVCIYKPLITKFQYDSYADMEFEMPLTQTGYNYLALSVARVVRSFRVQGKCKVICVDGDHTLWKGECANDDIQVTEEFKQFQEFLHRKKSEGILLVLLSKNKQEDVDRVFLCEDMVLKAEDFVIQCVNWNSKAENIRLVAKQMNLGLHNFLFIDDNAPECEEMILSCPQVSTLQYPKNEGLIYPFIQCLWDTDIVHITTEAQQRTELYRSEIKRVEHLQHEPSDDNVLKSSYHIFENVLRGWNMELKICKTTVASLASKPLLKQRTTELLVRTNQFKLNSVITDINKQNSETDLWLVSLKDDYGMYGIISVILFGRENNSTVLLQWVMSCRALGRQVEHRILTELYSLREEWVIEFEDTGRNVPTVTFLKATNEIQKHTKHRSRIITRLKSAPIIDLTIHKTTFTKDIEELAINTIQAQSTKQMKEPETSNTTHNTCNMFDLCHWIVNQWSDSLLTHVKNKHSIPKIVLSGCLVENIQTNDTDASVGVPTKLQRLWMDVLETKIIPISSCKFINCGGDSFKAVHLISKIHEYFGVTLSVLDVMAAPSFDSLTSIIKGKEEISKEFCEDKNALNQNEILHAKLSDAQKRMVVIQNTIPDTTAYTETVCLLTSNKHNPEEIFEGLVKLHPSLLATIDFSGNDIRCNREINVVQDKSTFNSLSELSDYITENVPVFELINGPVSLFKFLTWNGKFVFVVHVHHVIVDDMTLHQIKHSLKALLENSLRAPITQRNDSLSAAIDAEALYKNSPQQEVDKNFWEEVFADCPETSSLSLKPDSTGFEPLSAKTKSLIIHSNKVDEIKMFCRENAITEFQYSLACFVLVLQRYMGTEEVILAVPVTTRESQNIIKDGLFVNTVLFRYKVNMESSFSDLIQDVAQKWMTAFSHSKYPLNKVSEIIWEKSGKSLGSVATVMFNYGTFDEEDNEVKIYPKHAKMLLSVDIAKKSHGYNILCEYACDFIDQGIVVRLAKTFYEVLCGHGILMEESIKASEFLSEEERNLIDLFTRSEVLEQEEKTVYEMFYDNVQNTPEQPAIRCKDIILTYKRLLDLSDSVAIKILNFVDLRHLADCPIVLLMDKDELAIASMFAVWKIGGHFLPISLMHMSQIENVVESVNACLVVTNDEKIPSQFNLACKVIDVINLPPISKLKGKEPFVIDKEQFAYAIQTSGSTGKPKTIRIRHESLSVLATAWRHSYHINLSECCILQWAPFSFDVFIGDIIRGLCCTSGEVIVCPDEKRLDIDYCIGSIKKNNVTMLEVTPQFGHMLVENSTMEDLKSLTLLILGSDTLQKEIFKKVKSCLRKEQRLINSYGMSEATIDSSYFESEHIPETRSGSVPVGKPLPGVVFKVLEPESLRLCPIGTIGELFIGGNVVGTGDTEVMTLPSGEKLLKTNDKACWLPSGDIEIIGRVDSVRKLRGFRINTAEIENTILHSSTHVREACVTILSQDGNAGNTQYLCAFVVKSSTNDWPENHEEEIIEKIRERHPYYMVPDILKTIEQIPLSMNGKVNTRGLPTICDLLRPPDIQRDQNTSTVDISVVLRQCFAECLGLEPDYIDDSRPFFEQGGHSLMLIQYHALIRKRTDYKISITDVFSYPSIKTLTSFIANKTNKKGLETSCPEQKQKLPEEGFAITGVGLRLPNNVRSLPELWELFQQEKSIVSEFPEARKKDVFLSFQSNLITADDVYKGAFLSEIDRFDNNIFGIAAAEAENTSPEQRIFLEVASEALCQGTNIADLSGRNIGIFLSNAEISYSKVCNSDDSTAISGQLTGMIASRIAYTYNLKGPTMLIDTACSSALSALKIACESIIRGDCSAALVGGMNVVFYPSRTGVHGDNGILSPDFKCCPFDKNANGTVVGEGFACFYVEPLQQAIMHKKYVYAVVKSVATNSVGKGNGITAPSSISQQTCIQRGLQDAAVTPADVSFFECHGTGTVLGDKIELSALATIFNSSSRTTKLPIGSVKSVLGHWDYAAGFAGLLKLVCAFMFEDIPPTLCFGEPHTELLDSMFYVPDTHVRWKRQRNTPRIAGLSSFGLTGTNCHAVLSDAVQPTVYDLSLSNDATDCTPLLISGASFEQIKEQSTLHETLFRQTVQKHNINSLALTCFSIAKQLKNLKKAKMYYENVKLVIKGKNIEQLLSALQLIISSEGESEAVELASARDDIYFQNQKPLNKSVDSPVHDGINTFLQTGQIAMDKLFPNLNFSKYVCAPGVVIAMCNKKRFWPHSQTINNVNILRNNGLGGHFNQKVSSTREIIRNLSLAPSDDLLHLQGLFCSAIIIELFRNTPLKQIMESEKTIHFNEIFEITTMDAKYKKLFFIMIRELNRNEIVSGEGTDPAMLYLDVFRFVREKLDIPCSEKLAVKAVKKYPGWADCFRFPLHCSKYYKEVLWGRMSPLSVIYPQGNLNFMFQFDKLGDLLGEVYYNMYMQLIVEYASSLSIREKKVRILEVGAGMGHVTRQLLPRLCEIQNMEYWFTDLGKAFVENAKTVFSEYESIMKFATFDITKNALQQGLLGKYDIIISYNVIHTTESILKSVVNLKSCLGPRGTLFIIESAKNETWATLAWGILDGWWYFKDYDLRPYEPMLEPEKWENVLSSVGFKSVLSCPTNKEERKHVEKFLFVCCMKEIQINSDQETEWWHNTTVAEKEITSVEEEPSYITEPSSEFPKNAVKEELKRIWCELLGVSDIAEDDDFNALGGESLLAIQMMSLVRKNIGYQLEIADTFCYTSLGALGDYITDMMQRNAELVTKKEVDISESLEKEAHSHTATLCKQLPRRGNGSMLLFPGQGSQKIGMCLSMKQSKEALEVFKAAETVLGYNVFEVCSQDESTVKLRLSSTEFVQIALFTGCVAKISQLRKENSSILDNVTHVAGLSVGEFVALVFADVLSFNDALKLVQFRGSCMEAEVAKSPTAMASILGPNTFQLQQFLDGNFPEVKVSTYLADNQHTVAGTETDIDNLVSLISNVKMDQLNVTDVRRLKVTGAFHSRYMKKAAIKVKPLIESCEFKQPKIPIVLNVTGKVCDDPDEIKNLVSRQLEEAVQWRESMITAYDQGVRNFVEVAPARVLSSIVRNRIQSCSGCTCEFVLV